MPFPAVFGVVPPCSQCRWADSDSCIQSPSYCAGIPVGLPPAWRDGIMWYNDRDGVISSVGNKYTLQLMYMHNEVRNIPWYITRIADRQKNQILLSNGWCNLWLQINTVCVCMQFSIQVEWSAVQLVREFINGSIVSRSRDTTGDSNYIRIVNNCDTTCVRGTALEVLH